MGTSFDRLKEALADRYALEREIGAGDSLLRPQIALVLNWFAELRAKVPR